MAYLKITAFLLVLLALHIEGENDGSNNRRGAIAEENRQRGENDLDEPIWMKLCRCAKPALQKMQVAIAEYSTKVAEGNVKKKKNYRPPALDEVINRIKKIAHDCTKQPQCRCPKGYFKTNDGYHCLKISNKGVSCQEAVNACEEDTNARLAVAKDHERLTDLADYIREIDPTDESFYWIGLSYNRTNAGLPVWTWEDGTRASYAITKDLKNSVKKSLQLSILNGDKIPRAIERVAISKNYKGTHWKQETCLDRSFSVKHKYICEFLMFKLQIKAVSASSRSESPKAPTVSGKRKGY